MFRVDEADRMLLAGAPAPAKFSASVPPLIVVLPE
jgi:hypothetical protein